MKENNTFFDKIILGLEVALVLVIPFIIWWSVTPTNVLNSNFLYKLLELVGIGGSGLIFFAGIPIGTIGIIFPPKRIKLRIATIALSIINLLAGIIEILILVLIFCAVVFGGATV